MFGLLFALGFVGLMLALLFSIAMAKAAAEDKITRDDLVDDPDRPDGSDY